MAEAHVMQYKTIHFTLNGRQVERTVDVRSSLTDLLRNDFRMTSVKKGCEVGECGACNVLIDGEAFNSCIYLAVWAEGKSVRTLEGLLGPNGELSDIQQAFVDEAAIQCGFCTPGFILTAVEISGDPAGSTPTRSCASCSPATCAAAPGTRTSSGR
jgi:carbon-monoxide dehydrogenase small subunit